MKQLVVLNLHQVMFFLFIMGLSNTTIAQKPILVHNQDTTYFLYNPTLEEITVLAHRLSGHTTLSNLIDANELTTSVSGLTKDLQRDLPSMIRIYTPQAIPLLTKYTSNNSLTSTIPDSAIRLELLESNAKYPNPDAPVIMRPNYRKGGSLSISPLIQNLNLNSGAPHKITGSLSLARSGALKVYKRILPELAAFNTTYSGFGALHANFSAIEVEFIGHHFRSQNSFKKLLDVTKLYESDLGTNFFTNLSYKIDGKKIHAGFTYQSGREHREVIESDYAYQVNNEIENTAYTLALSSNTSELRTTFHNLYRIYPWSRDSVRMQRFETLFKHDQQISPKILLAVETKYDYNDKEPSLSGKLQWNTTKNIILTFNSARLYDAVGSEGMNSLMYSVQTEPHPWTVIYHKASADLHLGSANIYTALSHKKIHRGWYGKTAYTRGWIARMGAKGEFRVSISNDINLGWNIEWVSRNLSLDIINSPTQIMPGPAKLEAHLALYLIAGKMSYNLNGDTFINRQMRITEKKSANLHPQYFLTLGATRRMGILKIGASVNNTLALLGEKNYIMAHYTDKKGMKYVPAPLFINLDLGVNFY